MKKLLTLTLFQLRDKLDFSWVKQKKTLIQSIVFGVLKFLIVAALTFGLLFIFTFIELFSKRSDTIPLYTVFFVVLFILSLISTTMALTKSLYFDDDNKTLVTLPATSNQLFFSKIFVYLLFELKKSLNILVPATLGFIVFALTSFKGQQITFWPIIWFPIPIIIGVCFQVFLGAILSIPALYIYKFYKRFSIVGLITLILALAGSVVLTIFLINLIPENIDLNVQWPQMKSAMRGFIYNIDKYAYPFNFFTRCVFGEQTSVGSIHYRLSGWSFAKIGIGIGMIAILVLICYLAIKPFYFTMISKTFEFDKNPLTAPRLNKVHRKYVTFANKEVKLSFRDFDISGEYIAIYILVPILLLLMDRIISAFSTSLRGNTIALAVNVLLTTLPLLASNSMIATLYSKEGRAAYMKKTNPVNPLVPLISKLIFNLFFCIPSIAACAVILGIFTSANVVGAVMFGFAVLFVQYGHILYSASQDIMNPQNEAYATSGSNFNNPNETKTTVVAFIISFVITVVAYLLFLESQKYYDNYTVAFLKILLISMFGFGGSLALFVLKIKAFYYEK